MLKDSYNSKVIKDGYMHVEERSSLLAKGILVCPNAILRLWVDLKMLLKMRIYY